MGIKRTEGNVENSSSMPKNQVNLEDEGLEFESQQALTGEEEAQINEAEAAQKAPEKSKKEEREEMRAKRDEFVKNNFDPTAVEYLKDKFNIDIYKLQYKTVKDIANGHMTEPLSIKVVPMVYDKKNKMNVAANPIESICSMRFIFPHKTIDGKYVPVAIGSRDDNGKEMGVYVETSPCYSYVKSTFYPQTKEYEKGAELVNFTDEQIAALESIGIESDALYAGNFNSLDQDTKRQIAYFMPFDVVGAVKIDTGMKSEKGNMLTHTIRVAGKGQLVKNSKGEIKAVFQSAYNMKRMKNQVLDLNTIRTVGNVTIDLYTRDADNKIVRIDGKPMMNETAEQLIKYGRAFGPVLGIKHTKVWEDGKPVMKRETGRYQVSVLNGGLYITEMVLKDDLDKDGNKIMYTGKDGQEKARQHYEVRFPHINEEKGTVRIGYQDLKPVSDKDLDNYRRGRGGFFADLEVKDNKGNVTGKREVFAIADNQRNGFSTFYSEKATQMIKEDIKESLGKVQDFHRKNGLSK